MPGPIRNAPASAVGAPGIRLPIRGVIVRYPKLQAAIDELLAKAVKAYGEDGLAMIVEMLTTPEPPEPTAKPAEQPEKKAEEGNPQ